MLLRFSIVAVLIVCAYAAADTDNHTNGDGERILSRRRRYLIFPEGSSLQLVFDSVMTVPDYTIYVVTGVTVALAWGLPFKPYYPDEELPAQYEQGHLPLLGRVDENITDSQYVDGKKAVRKKSKTTAVPTTTAVPADVQRTRQNLLKFFQNVYQSPSPSYNSISYGPQRPYYQQQAYQQQPQYRPHNSIQYTYRNNSQPANRYYFGQSNLRPMAAVSAPMISPIAVQAERKGYDYSNYVNNGLNVEHERRPAWVTRPPTAPAKSTTITSKHPPNPYAEFIKYLTDTFGPQSTDDKTVTKKKSTKTKAKTTSTIATATTSASSETQSSSKDKRPEFKPIIRKLHTIYPAMGKRSIVDPTATHDQKFYLDHHRNTRHDLFGLIEKYVFAKGFNGTACVLKTLCEIGQRRDDEQPGSFLTEIVRAIFSLPKAQLKPVVHPRHAGYDIAHNSLDDCADQFSECTESIWSSGFLLEMIK